MLNIILVIIAIILSIGSYYLVNTGLISDKRYYIYMAIIAVIIILCIKPII